MIPSETFKDPNRYAREASLEFSADYAVFHGYQEFILTREDLRILPIDKPLQAKRDFLTPFFRKGYLHKRTFLDLGANGGFFCFWAIQNGAQRALALDIDQTYLGMIQSASEHLGIRSIETIQANMADWNDPADIVCALSLVHWIYSCTAVIGSLDRIIGQLSNITKFMLIVEWVAPEDPAILFFRHLDWNKDCIEEPYTRQAFEDALKVNFARVDVLGDVSPTRRLYVAFKEKHIIDLTSPLPLLRQGKIISSKIIAFNNKVPYWSQVYEDQCDQTIIKQTTLDLANREYLLLSRLSGAYFPKPISVEIKDGFSVVLLEKIQGLPLEKAIPQIHASLESMVAFFLHCLNLLAELKEQKIIHRDIRDENILVRDEKPVLIDFGWAISEDLPCVTPNGLGLWGRPSDGSFCDIYSMGKVFDQINQHRFPEIDPIIDLMTDPDIAMRIIDIDTIKLMLNIIAKCKKKTFLNSQGYQEEVRHSILELIDQLKNRNQLIKWLKSVTQQESSQKLQNKQLLEEITNSIAWRLILSYRHARQKIIPPGSQREKFYQVGLKLFEFLIWNPLRKLKN